MFPSDLKRCGDTCNPDTEHKVAKRWRLGCQIWQFSAQPQPRNPPIQCKPARIIAVTLIIYPYISKKNSYLQPKLKIKGHKMAVNPSRLQLHNRWTLTLNFNISTAVSEVKVTRFPQQQSVNTAWLNESGSVSAHNATACSQIWLW